MIVHLDVLRDGRASRLPPKQAPRQRRPQQGGRVQRAVEVCTQRVSDSDNDRGPARMGEPSARPTVLGLPELDRFDIRDLFELGDNVRKRFRVVVGRVKDETR